MTAKRNDAAFEQKAADLQRSDAIAAAHYAHDYVEVKPGVRMYRAKVAHQWAFSIIRTDPRYEKILDNPTEFSLLVAYILHFEQDAVRNVIIKEVRTGKILDTAWKWITKNELSPAELAPAVDELFGDLKSDDEGGPAQGEHQTPGGGAG